jgi:bifunctional non-homologous end joining protein LigD
MADLLARYRAKRDFGLTREPSGAKRAPKSDRLRFIIQKHDATRLHYDFRLEFDGVLKSWAVTKGPSLDPHTKRLAVQVEDHPLDYGDFEGTIPKGQYGGGTVMLWDRGYWAPEDGMDIAQGLDKGNLKFRLEGERLHGSWALVRMHGDDKRTGEPSTSNWLLIKHDDDAARPGDDDALLEDNAASIASGRDMAAIAAGKGAAPKPFIGRTAGKAKAVWNSDRPAEDSLPPSGGGGRRQPADGGLQRTTTAAVGAAPSTASGGPPPPRKSGGGKKPTAAMPAFVEPELCRLVERPPVGDAWAHEIKFDGYRLQLRVEAGRATLRTRKGLDWTERFPEIAKAGQRLPDGLFDGEVVALDAEQKPDFAGLQAALSDHETQGLILFLFDALFVNGEDLRERPLVERKTALQGLLAALDDPRLRYTEHFSAAGKAVLESACRMDLEGVVSKRLDAPYRSGRSDSWTKAKCRGGQEVVIGGWATTEGRFRSLLVGFERGGKLIAAGRVGTGFGRDKVDRLLPRLEALETEASPFSGPNAPRKVAGVHWVKPELVAEIDYAGLTGEGAVRQASFKALREDKPAAEVIGDAAPAPDSDAPKAAKPAKKSIGATVLGLPLSHPDKALWPDDGQGGVVTKLDLARYLEAVVPWLLPYVQGRPCSIIRTPDGIDGKQHFFQRHAGAGTSSLITLVTVSGDHQPYLQFDLAESLIAAAQSGATEFHPWNCAPGEPDLPGRFVFDLDPAEDLSFDTVIAAALEVRDRLKVLGLSSVLKTTGGKGLHIVVPFTQDAKNPVLWPEAKAFTRSLCEVMAADSPGAYTVNMSKKVRGGRIFLDYLRNDRMSTAVALLSPRARPGAPVSFPLDWKQAKPGLDPKAFTVRTAPALMAKRDPWGDWQAGAGALKAAIEKL